MKEMKKLGELGDIFIGLTYKPEDVVDEGGTIVLRSSNIQDGKLDFGDIVRVSCNVRDKLWVKENDILMCSRNGSAKLVGKTALISNLQEDMTFGAFMTIIRTPYNGYLQYFFKSTMFRRQLNSSATTTINQITRSMLDNIDVPVFDNDTADNIKAILGKCEKIIQERKVEINALDDLIKARFVEMFGDPVQNTKGWDTDTCKNLTSKIGSGATPKGGRESYGTEGISLIRSMNVYNNRFEYKDLAYITGEQADKLSNVTIEKNDVLLNITGASVARCCVVPKELIPARVNQHVAIVRCKDRLLPEFLCNMFTENSYQRLLSSIATSGGATREAITKQQIEDLVLIVPPIELQQQFVEFYKQVDKSKFGQKKEIITIGVIHYRI